MKVHSSIVLLLVFCAVVATAQAEFIKGGSTGQQERDYQLLNYAGATHVRIYAMWKYVEPQLKTVDTQLRVDTLKQAYAANITLLDDYIATLNLQGVMEQLRLAAKYNMQPIVELAEGTLNGLPVYDGKPFDPNFVGSNVYLAYIYRYTRAMVRKLKGGSVKLYQIENELNEAWLAGFGGQRASHVTGFWRNWDFLTLLMKTLNMAVKDEDPTAQTTMNVHTDISKTFHSLLFLKGYYEDAVRDWQEYMDVISIDAYPNNFAPDVSLAKHIGERVATVKKIVPNKKVFVMETGYSILNSSYPVPGSSLNFTEELQAKWVEVAYNSVVQNGGDGFMLFKAQAQTGRLPPKGGWSEKDVEAMTMLEKLYEDHNALAIVTWIFKKGNLEYLQQRLPALVASVEQGWGFMRSDGTYRQAVEALKQVFSK